MSEAYKQAGLNVSMPVLMYEARFGAIRRRSYFASEFIPGDLLLDHLVTLNHEQQKQIMLAVQEAFAKMKQCRLSHGDLKATNLVWFEQQLYFIDLDAARQHCSQSSWQCAHQRDHKRFLKNWRDQPELLSLFSEMAY